MRTWQEPVRSPGGGAEYGEMIAALRDFLDHVLRRRRTRRPQLR
jgi:hypothetical protein